MRFLCSFAGGFSHALPMFPVAKALVAKGHDVIFTGEASALGFVREAGFEAFDSGGQLVLKSASYAGVQPFEASKLRDRLRGNFAGSMTRARLCGVRRLAEEYRPHALVCDEMDFGGMLAAEALGIPHITVLVIASGRLTTAEWLGEALDQVRADHHFTADPGLEMIGRHLVVSPFPEQLRGPSIPPHPKTVYYNPFSVVGKAAATRPKARRRIYATFGTEFNVLAHDLLATVLHGLAELDVDVIATLGRNLDPDTLGPLPNNIRLERFVTQDLLLPGCDLVVSHGGSGSLLGGLAHGLPMLLVPLGADQPFNAERGHALGFAERLDPPQVTKQSAQKAVLNLLQQERFRNSARHLQAQIHLQMPLHHLICAVEAVVTRNHFIA